MAIEIDRLNELLLKMADENAPGREFSAAIAELARTGRFAHLRDVLPAVVYDELWQRYQSSPVAFVEEWEHLAHEMQQGFIQHARQRLTSLTRLQQTGAGHTPAWKAIQRALDGRQNDLLRAAVAAGNFWISSSLLWPGRRTCASAWWPPRPLTRLTAILMKLHDVTSLRSSRRAPLSVPICAGGSDQTEAAGGAGQADPLALSQRSNAWKSAA